jgi:hypothetical protein
MRRILAFSVVLALILAFVAAAPVSAGTRTDVTMTVTTIFDPDPEAFSATGLPGCASGFVTDGNAHVQFTPAPGVFAGFKVFDCGGDTGFVVRLNARFGPGGSVGTWAVVAAWGDLAGMTGAGRLTGDPIDGGIMDNYTGTVTL